jgi:hypothetical protein
MHLQCAVEIRFQYTTFSSTMSRETIVLTPLAEIEDLLASIQL